MVLANTNIFALRVLLQRVGLGFTLSLQLLGTAAMTRRNFLRTLRIGAVSLPVIGVAPDICGYTQIYTGTVKLSPFAFEQYMQHMKKMQRRFNQARSEMIKIMLEPHWTKEERNAFI